MKKRKFIVLFLTLVLLPIFSFAQTPVITTQPKDTTVIEGTSLTLYVIASNSPTSYQWKKNGTAIAGETDSSYTFVVALTNDGEQYTCEVTNGSGSVVSNSATITVLPNGRITDGLNVLYDYKTGSGNSVADRTNDGNPLNLQIDNFDNTAWTAEGLNTHGLNRIRTNTSATKFINACKTSNEMTFEAWLLPSVGSTVTNKRILSINKTGYTTHNFAIIQYQNKYYYKLRTSSDNTTDGLNGQNTDFDSIKTELTHLAFTYSASESKVKVYKNGQLVSTENFTGNFSNWDDTYEIVIGNEASSDYYWEGTYYLTALYSRALSATEIEHNFNQNVTADIRPSFIINPKDKYALQGAQVAFNAEAIGTVPFTYQWLKNDQPIANANSKQLVVSANTIDNGALYQCRANATNGLSGFSSQATLNVTLDEGRVTGGQQLLYLFEEESGSAIHDSSSGTPMNMTIFTTNAVSWEKDGLSINSAPTIATTGAAQKIIDASKATNELTIEAWVMPSSITESTPANIISLAQDSNNKNFSLTQTADSFYVTLKTSTGMSTLSSTKETAELNKFNHIIFTRAASGEAKFYVNGTERNSITTGGDLSSAWVPYILTLANETGGGAPWLGKINLISIYDRSLSRDEVAHNYTYGAYGVVNAPTSLTLVENSLSEIKLLWTDNSNNELGFIIERGTGDPVVYTSIDTVKADSNSYTDMNIIDNTNYKYRVSAYNAISQSDYSNVISVLTMIHPILAPTNFAGSIIATGQPKLTWNDNSDNELGFVIERKKSGIGTEYSIIDSTNADVMEYTDFAVEDSTQYIYKVYAYNKDTISTFLESGLVTVLTDIENIEEIPNEYNLSQNYPNPFNPTTVIKFGLPENANVSLTIYNVLGQQVHQLLYHKNISAGYHNYKFNAKNLPSGIYIYKLTAKSNKSEYNSTKKMLLIK